MSISRLPPELLMQILPELELRDMLRCRQVSQAFKDIVDENVGAQYKIELAVAGMEDGPPSILTPSRRLSILRDRQTAWNKLKWSSKLELNMLQGTLWELYGGVLAQAASERALVFKQLPSEIRGIKDKEWVIPDVGVDMRDFGMDPAQDLLIIIEERRQGSESSGYIHLKSLTTGAPHPAAQTQSGILAFKQVPGRYSYIIQLSKDYLGVMTSSFQEHVCELLIWNWKTGTLCLHIQGPELPAFAFLNSRYVLVAVLPLNGHGRKVSPYMLVLDLETSPIRGPDDDAVHLKDVDYVCAFHYPPISESFIAFSMTVRSDPGPSWSPHPSLKVPFSVAREDRLFVVTIWLVTSASNHHHHQHTSLLSLFPASTLLRAVASLRAGETHRAFAWEEWGPEGSRMLPSPPTQTSTWVCYVYGMVFAMALRQGSQKVIITLDFNHLAIRRALARARERLDGDENKGLTQTGAEEVAGAGDGEDEGGEIIDTPRLFYHNPQKVFQQDVRTALPYRMRKTSPSGTEGVEGEGHFDAVMISEDSLIMVSSQSHIRKYRILTF